MEHRPGEFSIQFYLADCHGQGGDQCRCIECCDGPRFEYTAAHVPRVGERVELERHGFGDRGAIDGLRGRVVTVEHFYTATDPLTRGTSAVWVHIEPIDED